MEAHPSRCWKSLPPDENTSKTAIKGVSSRASEALGESEETSCWHPAVPAVTDYAVRSVHDTIEQVNNHVDTMEVRRGGGYPLGS